MGIGNFSSLFELAAGINIALVAVEYSKAYTRILSDKVFKFPEYIKKSFKECYDIICERETLNNIKPVTIEENNTLDEIERCKRNLELFESSVKEKEENLSSNIHYICESKSFSSLSLWMFLYCVIALFIGGFETNNIIFKTILDLSFGIFSILSLLFLIIGWFKGEKGSIFKFYDYKSLKHTITSFSICLVLSFLLGVLLVRIDSQIELPFKDWIMPFFVSIPFLNFIAYYYIIKNRAKRISSNISQSVGELEPNGRDVKKRIEELMATNRINDLIKVK